MRKICCLLVISLVFASCLKEGEINQAFRGFTPAENHDGWQLATPSSQGMDSMQLIGVFRDLYSHKKAWALRSILVVRNNRLLAECYLKDDADRNTPRAIWSCTKQVTALIVGLAIEEGYIRSVNDPISDYLPEVADHPDKKNITIDNLLSMRSGIPFINGPESDVFRKRKTASSIRYVLGNKLQWEPGTHFQYNDGAPQLVSGIIGQATGKSLARYAHEVFFSKLGITNYSWQDYPDGVTLGAFGLLMPPRGLAKMAQCVCDGGRWNNQQLIPPQWLMQVMDIKVEKAHEDSGFGYFWWINPLEGCVFMWGHGGQFAIIYPGKNLVIVFTGLEQAGDNAAFWYDDAMHFAGRISRLAD